MKENARRRSSLIFGASVLLILSIVLVRSKRRRKKSILHCVASETEVVVIKDPETLEKYLLELRKDLAAEIFCGHQVLGLDCEWKPDARKTKENPEPIRNPVSVIQLSGPTLILVIQTPISLPEKNLLSSSTFGKLLSDNMILKVGNAVAHDVQRLWRNYKLKIRGFLDLNLLWNWIWFEKISHPGMHTWRSHPSLAKMTEEYLGMSRANEGSEQCSDWSVEVLSEDQVMYAAADAFASRKCFFAFCESDVLQRFSRLELSEWLQQNKGEHVGDQLKPYTSEQLAQQKARKKERRKRSRKRRKEKLSKPSVS